jgi:hypothetical protein
VKGSSLGMRVRVMAAFSIAFLSGAIVIFAVAALAGTRIAAMPLDWRIAAAAVSLLALAVVDVVSLRRKTYCLLGMRRQARQALAHRHRVETVAAVWGFDTGLAVTTFRVGAVTWGALVLTVLGFTSWWSGVVYGVAFTLPLLVFLTTEQSGERLVGLLQRRSVVQTASAVLLVTAGVLLAV